MIDLLNLKLKVGVIGDKEYWIYQILMIFVEKKEQESVTLF
jgi:hypothetical protein